jgi:hypothetical protein
MIFLNAWDDTKAVPVFVSPKGNSSFRNIPWVHNGVDKREWIFPDLYFLPSLIKVKEGRAST